MLSFDCCHVNLNIVHNDVDKNVCSTYRGVIMKEVRTNHHGQDMSREQRAWAH